MVVGYEDVRTEIGTGAQMTIYFGVDEVGYYVKFTRVFEPAAYCVVEYFVDSGDCIRFVVDISFHLAKGVVDKPFGFA